MLYDILRVLGVCLMIFAYFGGFLLFIVLGMYVSSKIEIWEYKKKMEFWEKYEHSIYGNHDNHNIFHIN